MYTCADIQIVCNQGQNISLQSQFNISVTILLSQKEKAYNSQNKTDNCTRSSWDWEKSSLNFWITTGWRRANQSSSSWFILGNWIFFSIIDSLNAYMEIVEDLQGSKTIIKNDKAGNRLCQQLHAQLIWMLWLNYCCAIYYNFAVQSLHG